MKFGIFFEISVPRPWEAETEYKVYQNCLEQVRVADELGVDRVNFLLNAVETVPQEEVLASLRLFASEVMPKFAARQSQVAAGAGAI